MCYSGQCKYESCFGDCEGYPGINPPDDALCIQIKKERENMIKRTCPKCHLTRFSADTGPWICEDCGTVITSQEDEEATP